MLKLTTLLLALTALTAAAQTNAPATNAPATNAPAALPPAVIGLGDIVTKAQEVTAELQQDQADLNPDTAAQAIEESLPGWTGEIDNRITEDAPLLEPGASLSSLQNSQSNWKTLSSNLDSAQKDLAGRVRGLDTMLYQIGETQKIWQATQSATQTATPETLQRIREILNLIEITKRAVQDELNRIYNLQNSVAAQDIRVKTGLDKIAKAIENARTRLFERESPRLWEPEAISLSGGSAIVRERISFGTQFENLENYLSDKLGAVVIHGLLLGFLILAFYWMRSTTRAHAVDEPALRHAVRVFDVPLANALLVALLFTRLLYPAPPALLIAFAGVIALVPAVVILRRLIEPVLHPLLYATIIAYLVDQVRHVVTPSGVPVRFIFILELLIAAMFILAAMRSERLAECPNATRLQRITRAYLHFAFFAFVFAGFANVFGYVPLSIVVGNGILGCGYLAVVFYASVRMVDALAISAMSIRPFSALGMVRRHHDLIYENVGIAIRWLAFALWFVAALNAFTIRDLVWQEAQAVADTHVSWFHINFSLGAVVAFPLTVWAAFLLSQLIRFLLEEEVYPRLQLSRGIPYAVSTVVHYTILVLGFFIAIKAGGGSLSQFSFLAGAFGVGLGFGLQNIFNNFVSGIILLFERPIKVGDVVQIDANTLGKVERIGIRASVILLTNGSELIVPNGNLISNPVTNWTLSNCERLIEIPVNVTSKIDPQPVIDLLVKLAKAHPSVLKNPPPQALLGAVGATLAFKLRCWMDAEEDWIKATSDLSLAISAALAKENIAVA